MNSSVEIDFEQVQNELISKFFHGLSNPVRLQIALSLMNNEKNVGELVDELGMKQSQISNQLACLKTCGFVTSRKEGKFVYYKVTDPRVQEMIHLVQSVVADNANLISSCVRV
ncbi:metalloregulator ArsR/SmtB family transcription factor [Aquibacillus sp. 3ASR75-11]|uniref:Metalloregulator ArsR/SmtB family transcription factor n=1 Tax=Terrihalobacillus insolitus TaxID=2950438 RepID=A0A9X4AMI5_9BACI|nr:metalloregulator ArsR/SmtB family transcription factor [Terrihalobacillus insolitus]MDC3414456.1 metalloregulator ArsR/SmtB family transcription factor [Terrihalobacillus insolitus]MDC3425336.1 metalloregulator ArsR/SmtB family transcription factor [Terrihalobacillus insolitus]